ncbi:MAG TPA: hypothetical protein DDZ51_29190 [Planctomycetaceae bacterium]|nr:hypothetical protein [Planctomycetaceae bacterium]
MLRFSRQSTHITVFCHSVAAIALLGVLLSTGVSIAQEPVSDQGVVGEAKSNAVQDKVDLVAQQRETQWQAGGWKMVQRFCIECHNAKYQEAEIDLSPFESLKHAESNPEVWTRALQMIRFGAMPPEDAELPTDEERRAMGDSIDTAVYNVTCDLRPKSGRVTARRLNRVEYNHSVRDLFGMSIDLSSDFPSDEVGGGFDNNADVLAMPPMLFEKYLDAAEKVASTVLLDPASLKKETLEMSGERIAITGEGATESFYGRLFPKESFGWVEFEVELPGVYRVRLSGSAASKERGSQAVIIYDADGKPLHSELFKHADDGGSHTATFSHEFAAGKTRLIVAAIDEVPKAIADVQPFPAAERLDEAALAAGREQFEKSLEVNRKIDFETMAFLFRKMSVEGPSDFPKESLPPSQSMIAKRVASKRGDKYTEVDRAAKACLEPLLAKAFRGPVDDSTVDRYVGLVVAATDRGASYHRGLQDAITAILVSPQFLFRVELPAAGMEPDEAGEVALSDYQLATRLSYFLWSSMPDDELLRLAKEGKLRDAKVLDQQVDRLLRDPKAKSLAQQFAAQWLGLRNLEGMPRDESVFPGYDAELVKSMAGETERLFTYILQENLPVGELLDADYTFIDQRLAKHYAMELPAGGTEGEAYRKVSLADQPRRGVLTHASILTLTSYPTRTSPVQRGKWILESVLGTPAPEPPPNVPELEESESVTANLSVREQLAAHRANPSCASCHRVMDQMGFGFEDFDAVGRYRGGPGIDASGELPGGRVFNGGKDLAVTLRKTESSRFAMTVTEKLLAFGLGRELSPADRCITEQIAGHCQPNDYPLADLVKQVVASRPFQYFQVETGANHDSK